MEISYPCLTARNHAVKGRTPAGRLLPSGLFQTVVIEDRDGTAWFSWVWPEACDGGRGAVPGLAEYEPLCPATEITRAAARIAKVIQHREEPQDIQGRP